MQDQSFTKHVLKEPLTQTRPKEGPNPTSRCWALTLPGLAQAKAPNHPPQAGVAPSRQQSPRGTTKGPIHAQCPGPLSPAAPSSAPPARTWLTAQEHRSTSRAHPTDHPSDSHRTEHEAAEHTGERSQLPSQTSPRPPRPTSRTAHVRHPEPQTFLPGPRSPRPDRRPLPPPPTPGRALRTPTPPSRPRTSAAPLDAFFPLFMYFFPLSLLPFPSPLRQK